MVWYQQSDGEKKEVHDPAENLCLTLVGLHRIHRTSFRIFSRTPVVFLPVSRRDMSGNRAAFLLEPKGRFEVRDAPIEQPGPGEVLVKVGLTDFGRHLQ